MLIALDRNQSYGPGCYLLCRVLNPEAGEGNYDWSDRGCVDTRLIQSNWDFPGVARSFGWNGEDSDIKGAMEYLDNNIGKVIEDTGYF